VCLPFSLSDPASAQDNSFKPLRPNPTSHNPRRSQPKLSNNGIKSQPRILARLGFFGFVPQQLEEEEVSVSNQIKDFGAGAYLASIARPAVVVTARRR
jgi:hypothetical protein